MTTPLNLTLKRGPSVWEGPATPETSWLFSGVAAGAILGAFVIHPRASRSWLVGLAVGIIGASVFSREFLAAAEHCRSWFGAWHTNYGDHLVDRASEDSFPASDPPQHF